MRALLRRLVPLSIRRQLRQIRRRLKDASARVRFVDRSAGITEALPIVIATYERPIACYPGQEARFDDKLQNLKLACAAINDVVIGPGEIFSFWRSVGPATARRGYRRAAALRNGVLGEDVGGSICLVSTVLYNVAMLAV